MERTDRYGDIALSKDSATKAFRKEGEERWKQASKKEAEGKLIQFQAHQIIGQIKTQKRKKHKNEKTQSSGWNLLQAKRIIVIVISLSLLKVGTISEE